MRWKPCLAMALLIACSTGPDAPPPADLETVCTATFCLSYPGDWEVAEAADEFVSLRHPLGDGAVLATAASTNLEALAEAAGETWPILTEDVARAFWTLIDGGEADLGAVHTMADGSVASSGTISSGRLWYYLVPAGLSAAVSLEVRGPNESWETHADALFDGIEPVAP